MNNCPYCDKGERLDVFAYEICELGSGTLYLFKEQSHPGRCILASRFHAPDLSSLNAEERNLFWEDSVKVGETVKKLFNADKINYGVYGDKGAHLHVHIVPKYKDEYEWGSTFEMNPKRNVLNNAECEKTANKIKNAIKETCLLKRD